MSNGMMMASSRLPRTGIKSGIRSKGKAKYPMATHNRIFASLGVLSSRNMCLYVLSSFFSLLPVSLSWSSIVYSLLFAIKKNTEKILLKPFPLQIQQALPFNVNSLLYIFDKARVLRLEEVLEPALGLEPVHKGLFLLGLVVYLQNPVLDLVEGPVACIDGKLRPLNGIFGFRVPAERAGGHDVHEGRAPGAKRLLGLLREVRPVMRACLRRVGYVVRYHYPGEVLPPLLLAGYHVAGRRRGRVREERGCARPLYAGVHVRAVVVAEIQEVVIALERA